MLRPRPARSFLIVEIVGRLRGWSLRLPESLVVLLLAAVLFLPWIGRGALFDRDETSYAEIVREMRVSHDWLLPRLNGKDFFEKPVLPFWFIGLGYATFGVNEVGARIVSALFGVGTALLTASVGRRLFGPGVGVRAGAIVSSSLLFILVSRSALTDPPFLFFFTAAIALFLRAWQSGSSRAGPWVAMYGAIGLATLCKGPVGALLPLAALASFAIGEAGLPSLRRLRPALGLAVLTAVVVPWYAYAAWRTGGSSVREFLVRENIGRYLDPMQHHGGPIWIYVPALFVTFLPWSVFLPGALRRSTDIEAYRFILLWAGIPFAFFSLAATKLPHYLLPIFPALSVLVAVEWNRRGSSEQSRRTWPLASLVAVTSLFPVGILLMSTRWPELASLPVVATVAVLPAGALVAAALRRSPTAVFRTLLATMVLFVWLLAGVAMPRLDEDRVVKRMGLLVREARGLPTYSYGFLEPGLVFYAGRMIAPIDTPQEVALLAKGRPGFAVVARERDLGVLLGEVHRRDVSVSFERGLCEDKGRLGLVLLRSRSADPHSHG
jgi:4-amino-4-deoxy-L-arabinose transferase-like glycosyltransferase